MWGYDDLSHVSAWLGYDIQLCNQTLMEVLLGRYFVDVVNVYNQLT